MASKKLTDRVFRLTGLVIIGNVKYHTMQQEIVSGVKCYYDAVKPANGYRTFVMFGRGVKEMMRAKSWGFSNEEDGVLIDIEEL